MLKIAIYAQHTTMAGREVLAHDDDCTSDDHLHLEFGGDAEMADWAARLPSNAFGAQVRATVRRIIDDLVA